jgi:hypothetical protein
MKGGSTFGEFDAIIASSESIYLLESKWDNLSRSKKEEIKIRPEQELRHRIFSWYNKHWSKKYVDWESFAKEQSDSFRREFENKKMIPCGNTKLAKNLRFVLNELQKHYHKSSSEYDVRNVLLFFYNKAESCKPTVKQDFKLVPVDYGREIIDNFINLNES